MKKVNKLSFWWIHWFCSLVSQTSVCFMITGIPVIVGDKQGENEGKLCPKLDDELQKNFNLKQYISKPWYSHQQAETDFQGLEYFYCVRADYRLVDGGFTEMGYTVRVINQGQDVNGVRNNGGAGLCAYQPKPEEEPAKLAVAPCDLPLVYTGPYWVVAYQEGPKGYALVSGGPLEPNKDGTACRVADGGGLWLLTRSSERDDRVIEKVRDIAATKKFDLSVLHDVKQDGCNYHTYD